MMTHDQIDMAVGILAEAARPSRIILFGSHARGDAHADSDNDLLVIAPRVEDRAREMVSLQRLLRPLRVPADILVYSEDEVERWGSQPGSALYWALREGKVVFGGVATREKTLWVDCGGDRGNGSE
jgi:predicted nucleotidyltransferase